MDHDVRTRTLYVGGLAEEVTVQVLKAAFLPFGEIKDVQIPLDMATQKNKGFGFVEFEEEGDAKEAIENMADSELFGRTIRVNASRALRSNKAGKAVWAEADEWYATLKATGALDEADTLAGGSSAHEQQSGGGGGGGSS